MSTRITLFVLLVTITNNTYAQSSDSLQTSVLNVKFNSLHALFYNPQNSTSDFHADESTVIYAGNLWFGGLDINGMLHGSGEMYGDNHDFQPGPVMNNFSDYATTALQYNRFWKVTRNDIYWHQTHFTQPGYAAPQSITDWPGNMPAGAAVGGQLAPYYDYNSDGNYNPYDGDFPLIKGDEAVYFVMNDDTTHTSSNAYSAKAEVHYLFYVFNCSQDSALQRTVFADIKLFNRGTIMLHDAYMGLWTDFDIGNAFDDYVGTDVERGMFYAYNGDSEDENNMGQQGYGTEIPACGVVFLKGPYIDDDGTDNPLSSDITYCINNLGIPYAALGNGYGDGVIDNEALGLTNSFHFGNAQSPTDRYNALRSYWPDQTHLMYGGTGNASSAGAQANGLTESNYVYTGDSDPLLWTTHGVSVTTVSWSEGNEGNIPGDRRMIGSVGPNTYQPGRVYELNVAYVYARDYSGTTNSVVLLQEYTDTIRYYFEHDTVPCYNSFTVGMNESLQQQSENHVQLFPNPANDKLTILLDKNLSNATVLYYDITGQQILQQTFSGNRIICNTATLPDGIYFVSIMDKEKIVGNKKLIITH